MRQLIRTLRKNYWGVFDEPTDLSTQRDKVWIPLIRSLCEDVVKNIDLDQKDIQFRAKNINGFDSTELTRSFTQDYLSKMYFGEILDETERQLAIDGTVVWKTWEEDGELKRRTVDLLHIYVDPTEQDIQSAFRFTERGLMTPDEIASMTGWINTEDIVGSQNLSKNDIRAGFQASQGYPTTGRFVDVWECWGKIPQKLITGDFKSDDAEDYVDGHIIVSGLDGGDKRVHLIELNKNKDKLGNIIKPYEEVRLAKIAGRWYGLGTAERALALQEWLNTVSNLRINKSYVSQLGLFKIRKGAGITPQMLAKLPSNGAVTVQQMDDIQSFDIPPVDPTSYKDEDIIVNWAQKVTQAYPVSTGEELPASQTATAVSVQNTSAKSGYSMMKEAVGMFLQRWMDRHALPIIAKKIKVGDVIRISGDSDNFRKLVENSVASIAMDELNKRKDSGSIPSVQEVLNEMQRNIDIIMSRGDLLITAVQEVIAEELDTKVYVTNEDLDTNVTVQNLIQMLNLAPEYRDDTIKQIYDLLGLPIPKQNQSQQGIQNAQQNSQQSQTPGQLNQLTPQQITTKALTPQFQ